MRENIMGDETDDVMLAQSRVHSLLEVSLNIGSGFILSWLVWMFVAAPLFGYRQSGTDAFFITLLFTVVSILRSYFWRRFGNRYLCAA